MREPVPSPPRPVLTSSAAAACARRFASRRPAAPSSRLRLISVTKMACPTRRVLLEHVECCSLGQRLVAVDCSMCCFVCCRWMHVDRLWADHMLAHRAALFVVRRPLQVFVGNHGKQVAAWVPPKTQLDSNVSTAREACVCSRVAALAPPALGLLAAVPALCCSLLCIAALQQLCHLPPLH